MVKNINFVFNGLENSSCFSKASIFAEQAEEFGLEQELTIEAILDDERDDLAELL